MSPSPGPSPDPSRRERGSKTPVHETLDPDCQHHDVTGPLDEDATCELCASKVTREQAASAVNLRTLGS